MYKPPKRRKLTQAERKVVYNKCGGHCAYCGKIITIREMQADHVIPMEFYEAYKAVGKDIDQVDNMLPACRSCNNYKHTLSLDDFRGCIERWPTVLAGESVTFKNAVRFGMVIPKPHPVQFYFEKIGLKVEKHGNSHE